MLARGEVGSGNLFVPCTRFARSVGGDPFFAHVEGATILCLSTCAARGRGGAGAAVWPAGRPFSEGGVRGEGGLAEMRAMEDLTPD